ncbi:precorrin-6A synthase (deacetylating) [Pseudodonghicola flavimaris]|uniref:Precorrin-6A synthase [deacetylating] n=1 Tax=Pseudodonghicola flavimaris TaxID=3050036 RepID=A0ABT7F1G7_9RHOB|nr:precorrin-6A synthase (deacetylating) [Pseudodonghicola flavimaris]MDK3018420.1 precorrin-6A synthase (deacetylating) [Pseudodonghicola flavimaris]
MIELFLIGIGTGNPRHLTLEAIDALRAADLVLIPRKGPGKDDLAGLRRRICREVITGDHPQLQEFDLPKRDAAHPDYRAGVDDWHDAIARIWATEIRAGLPQGTGKVGFLVWGDPSLYDSTLRIAERVAADLPLRLHVIPGITSIQALTAGHAIPLNRIGAPVTVTTGRRLRDHGWPGAADSVVVMLDAGCAFDALAPEGIDIWWSAYAGMAEEIRLAGPLAELAPRIAEVRAEARARHGWIMDIYLMRRRETAAG